MQTITEALEKLEKSKFRSSFHLTRIDLKYIDEKGIEEIQRHATEFVKKKLAPSFPKNDGKQTPMKGHPVFKAMHATAFCCRSCMNKWYRVPLGVELTEEQQEHIVNFLMVWIEQEYMRRKGK